MAEAAQRKSDHRIFARVQAPWNLQLFAALNVATGHVQALHTQRCGRVEFLAFMNQVVARYPDREIHVILDNLSIHKPKHDKWL